MSAKAVELADAIVAQINDGSYDFTVSARRRMVPVLDAEALTTLHVSVFTGTTTAERIDREEDGYERNYRPVVTIQKRLEPGASEEAKLAQADALQELVTQIEAQLQSEDLASLAFMGFEETEERPTYGIEPMRDNDVFAAAIELHYTD